MRRFVAEVPIQFRVLEADCLLRIRELAAGQECAQFLPPASADRLGQRGIPLIPKEEESRGFPIFLSHEQHWDVGGKEQHGGSEFLLG